MRAFTGNLFIFIFIGVFSALFLVTTEEYNEVKSITDVLDDIHLSEVQLMENSVMLDANGEIISDIYSAENRIQLPFEEIPQVVIDALLAAEDQAFYEHHGFDLKGITRALLVNGQNQSLDQGASTITQQLVRNLYLTNEKTYERKLTELLYSYQLEQQLTKEDIIEKYINTIYFQNGTYGIEAASQFYFSKPASSLTLGETAFLCAIPNNPNRFDPLKNIDETHKRKEWILLKMLETTRIDEEAYEVAMAEEIVLNRREKIELYPDYSTYVLHEFKQLISDQEGYSEKMNNAETTEEIVELEMALTNRVTSLLNQGIIIETALQPEAQQTVKDTIETQLGHSSIQAAAALIDHEENEIVAITGGKQYKKHDFHRGYQAYRQPGSSIKPLLVYGPYVEEAHATEGTTVDASPFSKNGYSPQNYGGAVYGNVSMAQAFKRSYNTAAVRLLNLIGPTYAFSNYFNTFDFEKIVPSDYYLPSALGGLTYGVSVLEMTQAYTAFMTDGIYHSPKAIKRVTDKYGNELYAWPAEDRQVWSKRTSDELKKMLHRVVTEGTGRRASFRTSGYIGGKTGTTNDYHDLWFIGSTDKYTSGIWLGYDQPQTISNSLQLHTQIWRSYMSKLN